MHTQDFKSKENIVYIGGLTWKEYLEHHLRNVSIFPEMKCRD